MITKDKIKIKKEYTHDGLVITGYLELALSMLINSQFEIKDEKEVEEIIKEQMIKDIYGVNDV
jgi:hypothetical protein